MSLQNVDFVRICISKRLLVEAFHNEGGRVLCFITRDTHIFITYLTVSVR